ncbi:MAG: hypothetical protein EKK46_12785 [Rhodocyclaceae bacterium]|nr:MAG: hypothetical protein EKK46_12785 [Rhodocyclaceae bacterium]
MKRRLSLILGIIFVIAVMAVTVAYNLSKPRILILQSYGPDYAWTRDVDAGIRRVLGAGNGYGYVLRWHYMDTKRHPWPESKQSAGLQARRAIDDWQPNLILAVDDDAQEYAAKYYANQPGISIVFAGTNGSVTPYGYDGASNVTGILERMPLAALKEALLQGGFAKGKGKRPLRVIEICDNSETVQRDHEFIAAFDWKPMQYLGARLVSSFPEWQQAVAEAGQQADLILTTNYRKLTRSADRQELVPPQEVVAWTEAHSKLPIVGINGFFVEDGGMLAIATSPFEQGEVAARMARDILEKHTAPASIPIASTRQFIVLMRPDLMARRNVRLPQLYEAFARATNNYFDAR